MTWSLGEIEALSRKATRGAGYSWGLAEEAGRATRFLAAMGLPGPACLARVLTEFDGTDHTARCPDPTAGWSAPGPLCPITTGATLSDHAALLENGPITLGPTLAPALIFPCLAAIADRTGQAIGLAWDNTTLIRADGLSYISGNALDQDARTLTTFLATDLSGTPTRRSYRATCDATTAAILTGFAHRTYAPDTPESRLSGAGAGLSDND